MTAVRTPLVCNTVPTFCRHNRFVAECPICSKGTVLDPNQAARKRRSASSGARGSSKPAATIALFWHIPWPNAETFGVCPWKQQILTHMLAAVDTLALPPADDLLLRDYLERAAHSLVNSFED